MGGFKGGLGNEYTFYLAYCVRFWKTALVAEFDWITERISA